MTFSNLRTINEVVSLLADMRSDATLVVGGTGVTVHCQRNEIGPPSLVHVNGAPGEDEQRTRTRSGAS